MSDTQHTVSLKLLADVADITRGANRVKTSLAEMAEAARRAGQDVQASADAAANAGGRIDRLGQSADRSSAHTARLAAAVLQLEGELDPAARAAQVLTARTELLSRALAAGAIDATRHAALTGQLAQAQARAAQEGAARLAAAVNSLDAEMNPAARAAQTLTARTELLNQALGVGAIDAARHATLMTQVAQAQARAAQEGAARLTAAVDQLDAELNPAARTAQVLAARTKLLDDALAAGSITAARHATLMTQLTQAQARAAQEGAARLTAAVDHLDAEMNPAARSAQMLAARTKLLDDALAAGAISAQRHAALTAQVASGYNALTGAGRLTSHQLTNLSYQFNDLFTQIVSGGSPFMAIAQQGPQITQVFGGMRQMLSRIPPVAYVAAAALALIVVPTYIVGARLAEIGKEARGFNTAIAALNPSLGISAQRLREISFAVADAKGLGRDAVAGGLRAIIANGRIQGEAMVTAMVGVAGDIAAVKGGDLSSWAEKLAEGFAKGAAGVRELDESLRFLTPAQARSIEAMDRQGNRAGALALAMQALEGRFGGSAKAMKSEMEDAFAAMGRAWDKFVEDLAKTDLAQKGAAMGTNLVNGMRRAFAPSKQEEVAGLDKRIAELQAKGPTIIGIDWIDNIERGRWQEILDQMKAERAALAAQIPPKAGTAPTTPPGTGTGTTPPATGGMTAQEEIALDLAHAALERETRAMAGNAAMRQVRLAGIQAVNAAYAAGRTSEAAKAEGLIAEQRAMLSITTGMRDQAAVTATATRGAVALTAARLQGADAVLRVEAANAAAAEAANAPINQQTRTRQLLADSVARQAAEGANAVLAAEAEAAAQERLAGAATGTADARAAAETANKVEMATAPLRAAMAVAEGQAKDQLREIIERLTGAIMDQDAAQRRAAKESALAGQRAELAGIVALTRVEADARGRSVREQRLALEHQKALNEAQRQGIDLSSDFGKEWIANADRIAKAVLESEKFAASKRTADAVGGMANALAGGDPVEIGNALAELTSGFDDLLATTGDVGDAFDLLGKDMLSSAKAGAAIGDLVGAIFGRTQEQQKNAKYGSTAGGAIGSLVGMKGVGSFIGNIIGGMIGGGRAERDAKAQKAAADLDALSGSIADFIASVSGLSQAGTALRNLDQQFAALSAEAKRLGTDTKALEASYAAARTRLRDNQNATIYSELAELSGDVVGKFDAIRRANAAYIQEALEGEADVGAARQVAYLKERQWLAERTEAELDALGSVVTLADRLAAKLKTMLGNINGLLDKQVDQSRSALALAQSSAAAYRAAQADFKKLRADLRGGDLSPLTPQQKVQAALTTYNSARTAAAAGDIDAQRAFADAASAYLSAVKDYAGSDAYKQIFDQVDADLAAAELSAGALASAADYQASLLKAQVSLLEAIKENLAGKLDEKLLADQLAALGVVNDALKESQTIQIGTGAGVTEQQKAAAGLLHDIGDALRSGLNIVDAKGMATYLDTLEAGLTGNNSEEAKAAREAIATLRAATADGLISATEAEPVRAALGVLKEKLGDDIGGVVTAINDQTGQTVALGRLTGDMTAALLGAKGAWDDQADAIWATVNKVIPTPEIDADGIIAAVTKGAGDIVGAIREYLAKLGEKAPADDAEKKRRDAEAAYQAQVDGAAQGVRGQANAAVAAATALPKVEAAKNQHSTGLSIDASTGEQLWIGEDRGDATSRARAKGLADALSGVARILESLTGGDLGSLTVEANDKYGIGYHVGSIRKINGFGINDFSGAIQAFVRDALSQLVGGNQAAIKVLMEQSYTDVASGLAAGAAAIYKARNPAPAFASGGRVSGPGSGTSDDILGWLSNGEHVIRAATAARYGHDVLDRINAGDIEGAHRLAADKGLARYAEGGAVGGTTVTVPSLPRIGPAPRNAGGNAAADERLLQILRQELTELQDTEETGQRAQAQRDQRMYLVMQAILAVLERMDARARRVG